MFKLGSWTCILTFLLILQKGYSQKGNRPLSLRYHQGIEYIYPKDRNDRLIETVSTNSLLGLECLRKPMPILSIYGGLTCTYAWGNIRQWQDTMKVKYNERVFGAGPVFLLRLEPVHIRKKLFISADFSGGFIFYSQHFPTGGDFYNFMWRWGISANYWINDKYAIGATYKFMHVSNGQGIGQQNPSYEGRGVEISLTKRFSIKVP